MAKKIISTLCLIMMILIAGGVVGFYFYCIKAEKNNSTALTANIMDYNQANEKNLMTKSFFSHDVLNLEKVCNLPDLNEKFVPYEYAMDECISINNFYKESSLEDYVWNQKYNFNSLVLHNQALDYYVLLNEKMSLFKDIKDRLLFHKSKMDEILAKDSKRQARLLNFNVEAVFDRQNPEIVYILFSFNQQAYWPIGAEEINYKDEILAYAAEIKIYKYNLKTDEFEVLYNAYEIKDNDTEKMVLGFGDVLLAPSFIIGINEKNDLMLSGGNFYWATGLCGSGYLFSFEGLYPYSKHYLLNSEESVLREYKYTQDQNSYNADLYQFLLFDYYPSHFRDRIINFMDEYKDL